LIVGIAIYSEGTPFIAVNIGAGHSAEIGVFIREYRQLKLLEHQRAVE